MIVGSIREPTERFVALLEELGQEHITDEECARLMDGDNILGRAGNSIGWHWGQKKVLRGGPTISNDYKGARG